MNKNAIVGVVLAASATGWFLWPSEESARETVPDSDLYSVRRDDLRIAITESGTMVAKDSRMLKTKISGESKIVWLVDEGKQVEEGEVCCKLDASKITEQIEQVRLEILKTEADLKTTRTELEIQEVENAANLTKAQTALERARKEIEKYRDGEAPQERRKLEVAVKDSQTKFNRAKQDLADSQKLLEQEYIKKTEYEDAEITFESAVVNKKSAEVALEIFDKYTFPMKMTELKAALSDAEREVTTAKKRGEATLGQKQVNVQQVEKRLKVQQKQLEDRQEDLENMEMKAPCPGIVVYGDPKRPWDRDRVKVGQSIYRGFTVLTIPDLRVMQVNLSIHEADISKLKDGLPAVVTTDSYPGVNLKGSVTKIASVANSGDWGESQVKKFKVEVTLDSDQGELRPGISAKCEILVDTREDALFLPLQSVFAEDGEHFCHIATPDQGPVRRKVEIGMSNETFIEVLAGVEVAEKVLLYNPHLPNPASSAGESKDEPDEGDGKDGSTSTAAKSGS